MGCGQLPQGGLGECDGIVYGAHATRGEAILNSDIEVPDDG